MDSYINLEGHLVDSRKLDEFYNGGDGSRVSDSEWDESQKRINTVQSIEDLSLLGFEYIGTDLPEGSQFAEEVH